MTYKELNEMLTGRNRDSRKLANNTYAKRLADGLIGIRLHDTDVLTFQPDGAVRVTSGGWKTSTTKDRLNQYLPHGYFIWQKAGIWYWSKRGGSYDRVDVFSDGDKIGARGHLALVAHPVEAREQKQLRKQIADYARLFAAALPLPVPGAGDCFYCQMVVSEGSDKGKTLGDASKDTSHLLSHMEEKYLVPSLAMSALKERGCTDFVISLCFAHEGNTGGEYLNGIAKTYLPRAIRRYLQKRLGLPA